MLRPMPVSIVNRLIVKAFKDALNPVVLRHINPNAGVLKTTRSLSS
jgi:hypothetical protein